MKYTVKAQYTMSVICCMPKTTVSTSASVRYSAVQYSLVRFSAVFAAHLVQAFGGAGHLIKIRTPNFVG